LVAGCGDDESGGEAGGRETADPALARTLGAAQLEEYKSGTVERAALEWWRTIQFSDEDGALGYYAKDVEVTEPLLGGQINVAQSQFLGIPTVESEETRGSKATLFIALQSPDPKAPPRSLSLRLVKEEGDWKIADNDLLAEAVARVNQLQEAQQDKGAG